MNDNVENLILTQLREIRGDIVSMKADIAEMKSNMSTIDQKVDGLTVMLGLLAGHVYGVQERVGALERSK